MNRFPSDNSLFFQSTASKMWVMGGLEETLPIPWWFLSCFVLQSGGVWPPGPRNLWKWLSRIWWDFGSGLVQDSKILVGQLRLFHDFDSVSLRIFP